MQEIFRTKIGLATKQAAILVGAATLIALADCAIRTEASLVAARHKPLPEVQTAQAMAAQTSGESVFVDARPADRFGAGHITGAMNLDLFGPFAVQMAAFGKSVPVKKALVVYSDAADHGMAQDLARVLTEKGYKKVTVLAEGLEGWEKADGLISKEKP